MSHSLDARLTDFAASLRRIGAIRSDSVARAFATVWRHCFVPQFRHGRQTITVPPDEPPCDDVLDLVYSHCSLVTSTGQQGEPPSSSSAPPLMARMLETLQLHPGLRVLEIGTGTGYNAALIAAITGGPVVTIEAGLATAQGALEAIQRLGLEDQITVRHGDGYPGDPSGAPYDRIIVTCGVAGLPPCWLDQLATDGLILAPIAHGGVHPVLATRGHQVASGIEDDVRATAELWADFMPACGPLRPASLVGHDPTNYLPVTSITRIPGASPARTMALYHDLWFFMATRDHRITRAYSADDTVNAAMGACALHAPPVGTAWVQTDGSIVATGKRTVAYQLRELIHSWQALGRPALTRFTTRLEWNETAQQPLWIPAEWELDATDTAARAEA